MNKLLLICLILITASGMLFSACNNDPYKDMKLIVEQESIEIVLNHDTLDDSQEGESEDEQEGEGQDAEEPETPPNTAYLQAHIENKNKKQSTKVLFDIMDKSLATISVEVVDGVYTATIVALQPGETVITVMSQEGNKSTLVPLKVIEPITGLSFDNDFSLAVAVGKQYQFSTSNFNYEPTLTNQKEVTYSLETAVNGITITEDGLLTVNAQPAERYVTVVARSIHNEELVTTTRVYIYYELNEDSIHIVANNMEIVDVLSVGKNTNYNNIPVEIRIDNPTEEYIAYAQVSDVNVISVQRLTGQNLIFKVTGIEQSKATITFRIGIVGITEQEYIEKTINVEIIDLIDTIYVNGSSSNSSITVFDSYASTADTAYGTKVSIEVTPTNAANKSITFSADDVSKANLSKLDFFTSSGTKINDILSHSMSNGGIIFVKPKEGVDFTEFVCKLTVVGNSTFDVDARVYNEITINVKNGINSISFVNEQAYIDLNKSDYQEYQYIVNKIIVTDINIATTLAGFELDNLRVLVQNPNVLSAKIENGKLYIKPLSAGITTLSLTAPNGISTTPATINVVVPTDTAYVDVNKNAYKEQIASIERGENNILTKINANVNSVIGLYIAKSNVDGTIWNLSYTSSQTFVATITNQGTIRSMSQGTTTITATFSYAKYDEDTNTIIAQDVTQEIEFFSFNPITEFNIGKSSATIYDINTIGYYDASLYSTVDFNVQMNDAYIQRNAIRIYIYGEMFDIENSQDTYKIVGQNGILFYHGQGQATFLGKINNNNYTASVGIIAEIHEFDRVYRSICEVTINKATKVNEIVVYNTNTQVVDGKTYYNMYFKTGLGVGEDTTNTQQIKVSTLPSTAVNSGVYYFAYDYLENNTISTMTPASEIIKVSQDGVVTPLRAGSAKVVIVPRDELYNFDLNDDGTLSVNELLLNLQRLQEEGSTLRYKEIVVDVADGTLENPYQIASAVDFLNISTGLNAHYEVIQTIDLSKVNLSALGNFTTPFTGSINGRHYLVKPTTDNPNGVYVDSKILGVRLNQTIENATSDVYYALFGVVKGSVNTDTIPVSIIPSFSNLYIEFSEYNVNIVGDYDNSITINLGLLTSRFEGEIHNVQIVLRNTAKISNASQAKINFGAVASVVNQNTYEFVNQNGETEQATLSSSINNTNISGQGTISIDNISSESYIGGFVGILNENCLVDGQYAFVNDMVGQDNEFVFSFNGQDNDMIMNLNIIMNTTPTTMAVGGVVGKNFGKIQNISSYGNVWVKNSQGNESGKNIGGVVGYNVGSINDVFSRCGVVGGNYVGGIVGLNEGSISVAIFESYQDGSSYVYGVESVGGLVGLMQGGNLEYGSSTSFITGDLYAIMGYANVGGLIGQTMNGAIISKSQATTKIGVYSNTSSSNRYAGGLVGQALNTTIQNSYSISKLYKLDTFQTYSLGGFIGQTMGGCSIANVYSVSNIDNFIGNIHSAPTTSNSYYLSSSVGSVNGGAQGKTSDDLKNINTYTGWDFIATFRQAENVNQGYPYLIYADSEFITVAPTSLKVVLNDSVDNRHIKISDNQAVIFSQKGNNDTASDYVISLNDLIGLEVSPLTNRIVRVKATIVEGFDVIKIDGGNIIVVSEGYCKIKISSQLNEDVYDYLELYITNGLNSFSEDTDGQLQVLLDSSKEIRYTFENGENVVGTKFGIAYRELYTYASLNYSEKETIEEVEYNFVEYNFTKIITANEVIKNQIIYEVAYITANFGGDNVKVILPWTEKPIDLTIFNGAVDLQLDKNQSNITPSQKAQVETIITTDLNTEIVSEIVIKNGDVVVDSYEIFIQEGFEPSIDNIVIQRVDNGQDSMFNVSLIEFNFDESINQLLMTFEFTPTTNLQNTRVDTLYDIAFSVADKFTEHFSLIVAPQTIERISVLHFPDGNVREDEVATDKISSGIEGLLKINIYPSFSQIDYVDITSEPVNGENISFLQKVYNGGQIERIYPDAQIITNGIRLSLASIKDYNGYVFDGNLYVSTLIKSNMPENLPFDINIVAYRDGQAVFTQTKTLYTQFSPSITIDYNSNYNNQYARGTTLNFPLNVNSMAGTITLSVEGVTDPTYVTFSANQTQFSGKFVGNVIAQLTSNINLPTGSQFTLRAELDTTVDNVRLVVTDEITLTVVDYIITGVAIDGYRTQGNNNILDIELNSATTLRARIIAVYATKPSDLPSSEAQPYEDIQNKIEEFELLISRQHDVSAGDVPVWYTAEQAFDKLKGSTGYYNYNYNTMNGGYYSVYGTRVSTVDKLTLNITYYYDFVNGEYQPILIDKANSPTTGKTLIDKSMTCLVNVNNTTTEEVPLPIYSQAEFEAMQEGAHYILMKDITLENYTPIEAKFASLDGNGCIININSLVLDTQQSTVNVGLFATVSSSTLIKNVVLNINGLLTRTTTSNTSSSLDATLNLTNISQVNFGFFAGTNSGTITNCEVVNIIQLSTNSNNDVIVSGEVDNTSFIIQTSLIISSSYTNNYIGLFAGQNSGYITNSRVGRDSDNIGLRVSTTIDALKGDSWVGGNIELTANGIVAGFVALNSNTISSSYVKNVLINNNSVIANVSSTAGFVTLNGGSISGCYAEGEELDNSANLKSQGSVAGFVLNNDGDISNSYASFVIRSPSNSAGFVNENGDGATIQYSYADCSVLLADTEVDDNASYRPFTGVNDFNEIQNEGEINYSYYIKESSTVVFADEPAIAINEENKSQISEYVGFAFVENANMSKYGIWSLEGDDLPKLNTANQIAISQRQLSNNLEATTQEETLGEPMVYDYVIGYELGSEINPYIVNTAVKFNNLMQNNSVNGRFGSNIINIEETVEGETATTKHIRIVNNLNFSQTSETVSGLYSSKVIFSAVLEGNNMLLSNITVTGEKNADQNQVEFGLFERLDGAVIKNLRLNFASVSATEIPLVGALAGSAVDSILLGIDIDAEGAFVQGKNIVGGLVGVLIGSSEVQTIQSNIGVRATYRKGSTSNIYTDMNFVVGNTEAANVGEILYSTMEDSIKVMYGSTSYAGGIIGAIVSIESDEQRIRTLKVDGNVQIGAERTGGIVGVNYGELYDLNFVVNIDSGTLTKQELSGDDIVGGLVGVNFNKIEKARITYEGDDLALVDSLAQGVSGGKTNLFISLSNYIGGIAGANIGGTILDSYSRVNVINRDAKYAGGIVGYSKGGSYDSIYTTGDVQSQVAFGGMFGYMDEYVVTTTVDDKTTTSTEVISQFSKIVLANNYSISTAQLVNGQSVQAGALAGYVNATDISKIFDGVGVENTNYAVYKLPLNTAGTSTVDLQFFGAAKFDKLQITQEEYVEILNNLNNFTSMDNDEMYGWFGSKVGDYATATYSTLYNNKNEIFSTYSSEDWTIQTGVFPLLNITTQATEIIITEDNKDELLEFLKDAPNATYIIRCDISLYSRADKGDLSGDWISLGSEAIPFSGEFLGEKITLGDGTERYPIINIKNPFINFGRSARVTNLTFNVVSTFTGNVDELDHSEDFYYGVVANRFDNSTLSNVTVTNTALDITAVVGMSIQYQRENYQIVEGEKVPSNYIGGVIGYAKGGNLVNVLCDIPMNINTQTSVNSLPSIISYVGGIVGYTSGSAISNASMEIDYKKYIDGDAYQQFAVNTSNGNIGLAIGYATSANINNISVYEKGVVTYEQDVVPYGSATTPTTIINGTQADNAETNVAFGGVVGYSNSSTVRDVVNELSSVELQLNSSYNKGFIVGGVVGVGNATTFTDIVNNATLNLTSQYTDSSANHIYLGGLVGQILGNNQTTGSNFGIINIDLSNTSSTTAYVGGVVGYVELTISQARIEKARNTANISIEGVKELNVGGVVGRSALSIANNSANLRVIQSYSDGNIVVDGVTSRDAQGQTYTISNIEYVGGLVGYASRIDISDSYSVGNIISKTDRNELPANSIGVSIGGLIGRLEKVNVDPSITHCYTACIIKVYGDAINANVNSHAFIGSTSLTKSTTALFNTCYYVLGFAQTNAPYQNNLTPSMHDMTANAVSYYSMTKQGTFSGFNFGDSGWAIENNNTLPLLSWARNDMGTKTSEGSIYRPYMISTSEQLLEFTQAVGDGLNEHYVMTNNIQFTDSQTRENFSGVFDGSGFIIDKLSKPLFNNVSENALINNVNLQNVSFTVTNKGNVGALANTNYGTISYVSTDGIIYFDSSSVAGTSDTMTNIGGIVGENLGYIGFSSSNVSIEQTDKTGVAVLTNVGGIAGHIDIVENSMFSQITNSYASGTLTLGQNTGANASYVGGLVGLLDKGNLRESYVFGRINYLNRENIVAYGGVYGGDTINNPDSEILDDVTIEFVYNDYLGTLVKSKSVVNNQSAINLTLADILKGGLAYFDPNAWGSFANDFANRGNSSSVTLVNYGYPYLNYANKTVAQIANKGNGVNVSTPYKIINQSGFELINFLNQESDKKYVYSLERDIYCFVPLSTDTVTTNYIDELYGTLDGASKTIYNMNTTINNSNFGFINTIAKDSTLQNIKFVNTTINFATDFSGTNEIGVGTIVGTNNGVMANISVSNASIVYDNCTVGAGAKEAILSIGGVVGVSNGDISTVNIVGVDFRLGNSETFAKAVNVGGMIGKIKSGKSEGNYVENIKIRADSSNGKVLTTAYTNIGGFVGYRSKGTSTIESCDVRDTTYEQTNSTINVFYINSNNIANETYVGGFVGYSETDTSKMFYNNLNIYISMDINVNTTAKNIYVGGIAGYSQTSMNRINYYVEVTSEGSSTNISKIDTGYTGGVQGIFNNTNKDGNSNI